MSREEESRKMVVTGR